MIDSSMSTYKDVKIETDAAARFIHQVVRPSDTLGVFEFAERVTQLADFSDDVSRLQSAVKRIMPGSGTSMYDAVVLGFATPAPPPERQAPRHRPGHRRRRNHQLREI